MRLLLDTCTLLFLIDRYENVPEPTREQVLRAELFVSVVSFWEIAIKHAKGWLEIDKGDGTLLDFWRTHCHALDTVVLPVNEADLGHLENLPDLYGDPFDRLLICQAIEHGLAIVTPDRMSRRYPVKTLWET